MNARAGLLLMCLASSALAAGGSLGTSAAVDATGRLWIAHTDGAGAMANIVVSRWEGAERWTPQRVLSKPEPVSADGENRPKIAAGTKGELYVAWTSPTSARYTADIRFARSLDEGRTWSAPMTVHRNRERIGHRFESMIVDAQGRVWLVWVDKRDLQRAQEKGAAYSGAALYFTYSDDRGASFHEERKLADHTCECCRIALALDPQGRPTALWRHVFADGRDHARATLHPTAPPRIERATFDRWRIDACPHHGPSLAFAADGPAHAVWFNLVEGRGRVFYGRLAYGAPEVVRELPASAAHADIATAGDVLAVAWKRFEGKGAVVESWVSYDGGRTFASGPTMTARAASDQPRLVAASDAIHLVWRREEGVVVRVIQP